MCFCHPIGYSCRGPRSLSFRLDLFSPKPYLDLVEACRDLEKLVRLAANWRSWSDLLEAGRDLEKLVRLCRPRLLWAENREGVQNRVLVHDCAGVVKSPPIL